MLTMQRLLLMSRCASQGGGVPGSENPMGSVPSSKNPKGCVPGSENPKGCVPGSKNPKGCGPCSVCLSQTVVRVSVSRPSLSRGPCFRVSKPSRGPCFRVSTLSRGPRFRVSWFVFPCLVVRVSVFLRQAAVRVSVSRGPCFRVSGPCFRVSGHRQACPHHGRPGAARTFIFP